MTLYMKNSISTPDSDTLPSRHTWRPLRLFNLYRCVIAGLFFGIAFFDIKLDPVGTAQPLLFKATTSLYLLATIINSFTIQRRKPDFAFQAYLQALIDLTAITLIMHASGGIRSGIGMLLIVAVAGNSLLHGGRTALQFAAIATLLMLGEHTYFQLNHVIGTAAYTQAGLLGASFFTVALLAHALARRIKESEKLAAQRGIDLGNMELLTQYIIQQMQTGVAVIDQDARIWQINESARQALDPPKSSKRLPLSQVSENLAEQYQRWLADPNFQPGQFASPSNGADYQPRFAKLNEAGATLIFLSDTSELTHQAQQLKLASLGRLSGSIAHEIRNPLGAISHAGQLLAESPNLDKHDLRLTEIIKTNTKRMNQIIENVLQLGRRDRAIPEDIQLQDWLAGFIEEFFRSNNISADQVQFSHPNEPINTEFDATQLHQVLWNLCQNGMRYSLQHSHKPDIQIALHADTPTPYLDVIDYGPGVEQDCIEHLFEPFFTTETKGSGLGLYIANELCENNHAHLSYHRADTGGSCFRLSFADPRRRRTNS